MTAPPVLRIGLLGCGTVGSAVASRLIEDAERLSSAAGVKLELSSVAVLHYGKPRAVRLPPGVLTTDTYAVVTDPDIDIIVEAIGSVEIPRRFLLTALVCRKSVVTANKELIAASGWELSRVAAARRQDLRFEAAVAGAAPVVGALRSQLAGERLERIIGVLNGTSNFILTAMESAGCSFDEALSEARRLGLAEADPAADVDGHDSAAKLAILASIASGSWIPGGRVKRWGIRWVTPEQLLEARELGCRLRLVAEAQLDGEDVRASVKPALLREEDPLAGLTGAESGAHIYGADSGRATILGVGAGGAPSASAVIGDILSIARTIASKESADLPAHYLHEWVVDGAPARELLPEPEPSNEVGVPRDPIHLQGANSVLSTEDRLSGVAIG